MLALRSVPRIGGRCCCTTLAGSRLESVVYLLVVPPSLPPG